MRVLALYPYLPAPSIAHGSARLVSSLLASLRAQPDLHLTLLCAYRPGEQAAIPEVEALCDRLVAIERRFNTDMGRARRTTEATATAVRLLKTGWPIPVVKLRRSAIAKALTRLLDEEAFDLVHVELATMGQYIDAFSHLPSVLVDHEAAGLPEEEDPRWPPYVRQIFPRFDRLLCLSEEDATDIRTRIPGVHPIVRPPAITIDDPPPRVPEAGRLFFFGSLEHEPNRDALTFLIEEILPRVHQQQPSARLVTAGFEGLDGPLARRAQEARVELLGFVPDLRAELARAALVLSPVRLGHGVRIKNVETLAQGVPLVTTTLGARGLPAGGAVVADDPQGLADAALGILAQPDAADRAAARAAQLVRTRHAPDAQAAATWNVWRELLDGPN